MIQDKEAKTVETRKQTAQSLGFGALDTAELVTSLNKLLAGYSVFYQKLRSFHWTVEGNDFFEVHEKLEEDYRTTQENIDLVAERVRIFGQMPLFTMAQMLEHSEIEEARLPLFAEAMVNEVVNDLRILLTHMVSVCDAAREAGDMGTLDLMSGMIRTVEKRHWMYSVWLKKK